MAGISFSGVGSGLDIQRMVYQLVQAEKLPAQSRIDARNQAFNVQISSLGAIKNALNEFKTALSDISKSTELIGQKVTAPDTEGLNISLIGKGDEGSYSLEVLQKSSYQKIISSNGSAPGTQLGYGTITLTNGKGESFNVEIADGEGDVKLIADKINQQSDSIGITARAMIVKDDLGNDVEKLVLQSTSSGKEAEFTIATSGGNGGLTSIDSSSMNVLNYAQDAEIKIDGEVLKSSTGTFKDAVSGIEINLSNVSIGTMINFEIESAVPPIKDKLNAFIEAYNSLNSVIKQHSGPGQDGDRNTLENNSLVRQIKQELRGVVNTQLSIDDETITLSRMGIRTDYKSGNLELDSASFERFASTHSDKVKDFFSATNGLNDSFKSAFDLVLKAGGAIDQQNNSVQKQLNRETIEQDRLNHRMELYKQTLLKKYIEMDRLVASLNSQSNAISGISIKV